jgi:hypothetical protein
MNLKKSVRLFIPATILVLLVVLASFNKDNDPVIDLILKQLNTWLTTNKPEKVYLQTDKPYYSAGDDIWFKAYVTIDNHQLSALSGSLNVELIDELDSVKQWIKLPVTNGITWGDFKLPDTLHEGNYRLRAYTNWMRNAGADYYFNKVIAIGNTITNKVFTSAGYTYAKVNGQQKTTAVIKYTDADGAPHANKPVEYLVQFNSKTTSRGKATTDDKGRITITYTNPGGNEKGNIATIIKLTAKNSVTKNITLNATSGKTDVQFFPESGDLINGIRSKVAFKAVAPNGLGTNIKGVIIDNDNKEVSAFTTRHAGMGIFALTPEAGKTYKAKITYDDGSENTVNLPTALSNGYVLGINNTDANNISIKITTTADLAKAGVYLVAQSGGRVNYVGAKTAGANLGLIIPKSQFPSGIVQFTLFSAAGEPLNERLAFIDRSDDKVKLTVNSSKPVSATREKVKINITAQNNNGKAVLGNFSATVIDESKVQNNEADETTILSHLLLTSDLRGYVEQPNYYFTNSNETTQADLDILMLTQGYRRFEWKPVLAGTVAPVMHSPEKFISVSGTIKTLGGKPIPNGKITMFSIGSESVFALDTVADAQGNFKFKDLFLKDSLRFAIQGRTAKNGNNVRITLNNNGDKDILVANKYLSAIDFAKEHGLDNYLKSNKGFYDEQLKSGMANHFLSEVTIYDKRNDNNPASEGSSNMNGRGNADQVITSEMFNNRNCDELYLCLSVMLNGVRFVKGVPYSTRSPDHPMLIMWDGVPIEDINIIRSDQIGSIEVLKSAMYVSLYGSRGGSGVLVITTKSGKEKTNSFRNYSPDLIAYSPKGYYQSRVFYSPKYNDPKVNRSLADLRSTIYWQPNISIDKSGHTSFEYYNAGTPGTYRVVIEGIDADGNLGRQVYRYKVE